MANPLESLVTSLQIDTVWGPTIQLDDPFAPTPAPNPFLTAMKPKITIGIQGGAPVVISPYGDPGETQWPKVKVGLLGGLALLLFLLAACAPVQRPAAARPAAVILRPEPAECPNVSVLTREPPLPPIVEWVPEGCPPQFIACLKGQDGGLIMKYLQDVRRWTMNAWARCGADVDGD